MTSELRPAVEVWRDAYDAYTDFYCHTTEKDPAAVIQAYGDEREAKGREEQAAELAKFKAVAETLAGALKGMQSYGCPVCNGDCGSANPPVMSCPMSQCDEALRQYKEQRDD